MDPSEKICIVIPCYNEGTRLPVEDFKAFTRDRKDVIICFVNDGSSDNTLQIIRGLQADDKDSFKALTYAQNRGKAEAVRRGVQYCNENFNHSYIAYLDADLATSLEECYGMTEYFDDNIEFCFGSRIMKIGSTIERKYSRHLIGRVVATFISNLLKLKVYDTQCGCKLFTRELSEYLFKEEFISKWLFDVEIFARMIQRYGREKAVNKMIEIPLKQWIDKGESKVKMTYFFRLFIDLHLINKRYNK